MNQVVCVPEEKVAKAIDLISKVLSQDKLTLKQLQKICSFLNFLCRCIVPGWAFTRCLYAHTSSRNGKTLKPHHHIHINCEMRLDLRSWLSFLQHPSIFCRLFIDFLLTLKAEQISMFSDASRNPNLGMGGICGRSWMFAQWGSDFIEREKPSIAYLELYAVVATVLNWLDRFRNQRIILSCHNQGVVDMINKLT